MIYLICILIFIFYFYILYKNPGEKSTLIHGKTTTIIIISLSFILISFIFLSLSNVDNMTEYENNFIKPRLIELKEYEADESLKNEAKNARKTRKKDLMDI